MFILEIRQTWTTLIISILFVISTKPCSPHWDIGSWCFGFARKAFISTIFIVINVHLWNETNLGTHNNLHSYCSGPYDYVLLIGIHKIDALDSEEKLFFPLFFLIINVHLRDETNLDIRNDLHSFQLWALQSCSPC